MADGGAGLSDAVEEMPVRTARLAVSLVAIFCGSAFVAPVGEGRCWREPAGGETVADTSATEKIDMPVPRLPEILPENFHAAAPKIVLQPVATGRSAPKVPFVVLSGLVYTAAAVDMHITEHEKQRWNRSVRKGLQTCPQCLSLGLYQWFKDSDPLARPIVNLPAPAYFATGIAIATGVNWLGWRMGRSRRFHKMWFVPQMMSIGGNSMGASTY